MTSPMALPASSLFTSNPKIQIKLFSNRPCELHRWSVLHARSHPSPLCFMKITDAHFGEPNKVKLQLIRVKERLWEATPSPVKEFPWREAADRLLKRLLVIGQEALKWSLLAFFIFSSVSDVIFAIIRNQELIIPIGLLIGCLMTDFLKETLQELFRGSGIEDKGLNFPLVIISGFFLLVKFISAYFTARSQVLLLHVANGGLLQALWLWRKENNGHHFENFQDNSLM